MAAKGRNDGIFPSELVIKYELKVIDLDKTFEEIVSEKLEFDEFTTCFKHERRRSALLDWYWYWY